LRICAIHINTILTTIGLELKTGSPGMQ